METWQWNGVNTPIDKLTDSQLHTIKNTLNHSKKPWFGKTKEQWLALLTPIISQREKINIHTISNEIINRRIKKVQQKADIIVNNMLKSSKQTISIKSLYEGKTQTN